MSSNLLFQGILLTRVTRYNTRTINHSPFASPMTLMACMNRFYPRACPHSVISDTEIPMRHSTQSPECDQKSCRSAIFPPSWISKRNTAQRAHSFSWRRVRASRIIPIRSKTLSQRSVKIIDRGWEVGLHGGHTAYLNAQEMKIKKERLEKVTHQPVLGYRNHYLRFKVPDTWEYLSKAGFQYDTTLGYADCAGFRNGMCHPFRPFNLNTNHEIDILEIPLTVMDGSLESDLYAARGQEKMGLYKNAY